MSMFCSACFKYPLACGLWPCVLPQRHWITLPCSIVRTYVECCPLEFRRFRPFVQRVKVVLPTLVYPADVIVDILLIYSTVHVCMYNPFDYTYFFANHPANSDAGTLT